MSQIFINAYLCELDRIRRISGSLCEQVIREAFKDLLKAWSRQKGLVFLAEHGMASPQKTAIRPDGTILHDLRVPLGYSEAKDTADDLDTEIKKKFLKGYPQDNIIFENSSTAAGLDWVLDQHKEKTPKDPTIREKFNTYRFADQKEKVADLIARVTRLSVETMEIVTAMTAAKRSAGGLPPAGIFGHI
jgi:hypothetical protein